MAQPAGGGAVNDATPTVAIVTGASSGIGRATALAIARLGTSVIATARRSDRLEQVIAQCRQTAPGSAVVVCDLRDEAAARSVVRGALEAHEALDAIVHCAGVPMRRSLPALTMDEVRHVLQVNYLSPVAMTLEALPAMLGRNRGTVVFVSSMAGRLGLGGEAAYSASKFAVCGFAESASVELAGSGVEVRLVIPGPIDTEIWDQEGQEPPSYEGELFAPELVADTIVAAMSDTQVEHYVPDLKAIVELKTTDFQGFRDGMVAALRGETPMVIPDEP
jgi:short-subunit dehydrogenase